MAGLRGMKSGTGAIAPSDVVGGEDEPDPEPIISSDDEAIEKIADVEQSRRDVLAQLAKPRTSPEEIVARRITPPKVPIRGIDPRG